MRLSISLTPEEFESLHQIAVAERRRPQEQASVLLAEGLMERMRSSRSPKGDGLPLAVTFPLAAVPEGDDGEST